MTVEEVNGDNNLENNKESTSNKVHPIYHDSSQHRHWRYTPTELADKRRIANEKAIALTRTGWDKEKELNPNSEMSTSITPPSVEEENDLIVYYLSQVKPICNLFQFPEIVEATAVSYIKRFYLFNSVIDLHPKRVMLTSLFLSTKTVNTPISISDFAHYIGKGKISKESILDIEFLISQNLRFEYATHPAHRAVWGIYLDMQTMPNRQNQQVLDGIFAEARQTARLSRLTNAEFIYTPSQIALGCYVMVNKTLVEEYIEWKKQEFHAEAPSFDAIDGVVALINIQKSKGGLKKETVQDIDKRLKLWQDPSKVEGTAMYKRKQEEADKEDLEKRNKRQLEAEKSKYESESVFGEPLETLKRSRTDDGEENE
ncbi:cyclin-like protein [Wallemia mellicola]|nr:cyclin-like protein [Wallemia mellicola]TIB95251.1 cyclin-like protein [Wallemia mellicola]TIC72745.1 cyclin-like protein [Wallemia mellicola]